MLPSSSLIVAALASLGLFACNSTVCPDGSKGKCEDSAKDNDAATEESCEDPNTTQCGSECVDTAIDSDNCGACGVACAQGEACASGACVGECGNGLVNCDGECIDPQTNTDFCGASGACQGEDAGENCGLGSCVSGSCVSQIYLGSLTATQGRFTYGDRLGISGAVEACQNIYVNANAVICSAEDLTRAAELGELVGAQDNELNPVTSWWVVDMNRNSVRRQCINSAQEVGENIPWSYRTAHIGEGATFVDVNRETGVLSTVTEVEPGNELGACDAFRAVPCCTGE